MMAKATQPRKSERNRLIGLIHITKADLKLDRPTYEALLEGATGKTSCTDMNLCELNNTLKAFENKGFKRKVKRSNLRKGKRITRKFDPSQNDPRLTKIWALWHQLCDRGLATRSARALNKFIKRQTGIEKMEWLEEQKDFDAVIEAIKSWYERETGVLLR